MEIHYDGNSIIMEDYKKLTGYGVKIKEIKNNISNKGQLEELEDLYDSITGKVTQWPIELWDMIQTTETALMISKQC